MYIGWQGAWRAFGFDLGTGVGLGVLRERLTGEAAVNPGLTFRAWHAVAEAAMRIRWDVLPRMYLFADLAPAVYIAAQQNASERQLRAYPVLSGSVGLGFYVY